MWALPKVALSESSNPGSEVRRPADVLSIHGLTRTPGAASGLRKRLSCGRRGDDDKRLLRAVRRRGPRRDRGGEGRQHTRPRGVTPPRRLSCARTIPSPARPLALLGRSQHSVLRAPACISPSPRADAASPVTPSKTAQPATSDVSGAAAIVAGRADGDRAATRTQKRPVARPVDQRWQWMTGAMHAHHVSQRAMTGLCHKATPKSFSSLLPLKLKSPQSKWRTGSVSPTLRKYAAAAGSQTSRPQGLNARRRSRGYG